MQPKTDRAPQFSIGNRWIGPKHPCFVIAEAGVNHDGDVGVAKLLVDAARRAGADAVKFQTFKASELASATAPKAEYQKRTTNADESQLNMLQRLELTPSQFAEIAVYCEEQGIMFLSSPFDIESLRNLMRLDMPAIKVPSGEIVNPDLLAEIGSQRLPVILSTGMATLEEVRRALGVLNARGSEDVAILHCVSSYPAAPRDVNLRAMQTMADAFNCVVGFSDHTMGIEVPMAAIACGASIIEKHLTLDHGRPGPDHAASLEPQEFVQMVAGIRNVENALGHGRKEPAECETEIAAVARRSLVANGNIQAGARLNGAMLSVRRPGTGISPFDRAKVEGRILRFAISDGTPITSDMLE